MIIAELECALLRKSHAVRQAFGQLLCNRKSLLFEPDFLPMFQLCSKHYLFDYSEVVLEHFEEEK